MINTKELKCPDCKENQNYDIFDLSEGSIGGEFQFSCDSCGCGFKVEFEFKPFVNIIKD